MYLSVLVSNLDPGAACGSKQASVSYLCGAAQLSNLLHHLKELARKVVDLDRVLQGLPQKLLVMGNLGEGIISAAYKGCSPGGPGV